MVNHLLSEYSVWEHGKRYAVVDGYYQQVIKADMKREEAFMLLGELKSRQRGTYPSILEAS